MTERTDRRYLDRHHLPGAEMLYKSPEATRPFAKYYGPTSVINLSKGGVCFETNENLALGKQIEMKIIIPGEKNIKIKGKVVWISGSLSNKTLQVGMQFLPFGGDKKYNPLHSLTRLRQITNHLQ
jgi:hypothetical protein